MTYITPEQIRQDKSFFIDDRNINRLMDRPLLSYKVKSIKLGMILRTIAATNIISTLENTRVYKFLKGDDKGKSAYRDYIRLCNNASFRSESAYNSLIENFSNNDYDIKKGAIVLDQYNLLLDGQHRACILLKKYGRNYKVDVVQFEYAENKTGLRALRKIMKIKVANLRALLLCCLGVNPA